MSMSLMLQSESKRTFAGWLWLIFTLLSTIALWIFVDTPIFTENLLGYISIYLTIASYIVVAIITIRPEKKANERVIGKSDVPPFFKASEAPSIYKVAESSFIAKELDNFYGNYLVLIGFIVALFFPLFKLSNIVFMDNILVIILIEVLKIVLLIIFIYFLREEIVNQKNDLRDHIKIVWRYNSIIAQRGWEKEYKSQIESLEDSIKIKNWDKAKFQINTLNEIYKESLTIISTNLQDFIYAFQFILGHKESQAIFSTFSFKDDIKEYYTNAKILGLEHHNSGIAKILDKRINNFEILESRFIGHRNKIRQRIEEYKAFIQADGILKAKEDHFNKIFNAMDLNLFHIDNIQIESEDFKKLRDAVTTSTSLEIQKLFEGVRNTTELYLKLTSKERKYYTELIEINLGKDFMNQITNDMSTIRGWFVHSLDTSNT